MVIIGLEKFLTLPLQFPKMKIIERVKKVYGRISFNNQGKLKIKKGNCVLDKPNLSLY